MTVYEKYNLLCKTLIKKQITVSSMESCTSGLIASLITDTEGASSVMKGGFVTYSNEIKILCGVPENIIKKYGVYSKETAESMAKTVKEKLKTDIGIGVTGTFGNVDKNNPDSVPGEVHTAVIINDRIYYNRYTVPCGTRNDSKLFVAEKIADVITDNIE